MSSYIKDKTFPAGFLFGTATAPYQIEGAWNEDGKGASNWDWRAHNTKHIKDGATGDVAVDHYHRWSEDVDLMKHLGLNAYRFGISWSRVQPDGQGPWNQKGLEFYDRLIDALTETGITPLVTLCHYEIPQKLVENGGWINRDTTERFADYASEMAKRYGDRVRCWSTLNEPVCINSGFVPAPETDEDRAAVQHHLMLAHGRGVQAIHAVDNKLKAGLVNCFWPVHAMQTATPSHEAQEKFATEEMQEAVRLADILINRAFLDPIYLGRYPEEVLNAGVPRPIKDGDMKIIGTRPDYMGINYYSRIVVTPVRNASGGISYRAVPPAERGIPHTTMGWEIYPEGLHEVVMMIHRDYNAPEMIISENGMAEPDEPDSEGNIHDHARIKYLEDHLAQIALSIKDGANVSGYCCWSLLDNLEWDLGWEQRFGLIHVDSKTLKRTVKDSGLWYREFIKRQNEVAE